MSKPNPVAFDDEDPFADSFAPADAAEPGADASAPAGSDASPEAAQLFEADGAEDAAARDAAERADAPPAAADEAFDWFAGFPKTSSEWHAGEVESPAASTAPPQTAASRPKALFGWFSAPSKAAAAAPAAAAPAPAPEEDDPALVLGAPDGAVAEEAPEAESLDAAPTVPAVFDDAVTQPDAFGPVGELPAADPQALFAAAEPPASAPAPLNPVAEMIASAEAALGEAVVPRIAIHVFAQRPETAAVAQTAAADRRLQRASTAVRPGGLPEALALYASSPTPALVIVENTAPAAQLLADLERLAEVCDPGTKVVVIGQANDIGLYRELMRRGVSEYLVPPLDPLQLIRTIGGLYADPTTPFVGRTIAFVGAKGGVGSSTLAHNVAWCLSERIEAQACVVDYDLAFGTAGLDFNQDPVQGLHDALAKPDRLDATLVDRMLSRCTERLSLLAAPATLDDDYDIPADVYEEVAAKIRSTAPFMVLDLPHTWSSWMRKTLLSADDVVLVAQPDLASLRNAKNMIELITKARPNDAPPKLVLNQVGLPGRPEIPLKDFSKALGFAPSLVVPFDAKLFGAAANNGQMIGEVNDKAKAYEALLQFTQAITRREAPPAKPKSLVERLMKGG